MSQLTVTHPMALSLWLPQNVISVYGLDIRVIAAFFSVPASVFRAYGVHLADVYGARKVLYWPLLVSVAAAFVLKLGVTRKQRTGADQKW